MLKLLPLVLFSFVFLFKGLVYAQGSVIPWDEPISEPKRAGDYASGGAVDRGHIYVVPNEIHPEEALPIFRQVPQGVYLSVGAERGFIHFALSQNATHLLLVDLVPEVVFFNRVNILLLKMSNSLTGYLNLREDPNHSLWLHRLKSSNLTDIEKDFLRQRATWEKFAFLQKRGLRRLLAPEFFNGTSYVREEALYRRLQKAAAEGRMQAISANLLDTPTLKLISSRLQEQGLKFAAVDISNAWERRYTGPDGVQKITESLAEVMQESSLLVVSKMRMELGENMYLWDYTSFQWRTMKKLREQMKTRSALTSMVYEQRYFPASHVVKPSDLNSEFLGFVAETENLSRKLYPMTCNQVHQ